MAEHLRAIVGKTGEDLVVVDSLQNQGFAIVARNYRKRYGEIDIIATKVDILAFVEVRSRRQEFVDSCTILPSKQRKILLVAREFLAKNSTLYAKKNCRFDVAFVQGIGQERSIMYIPNAFTPSECYE